MIAGLGGIPGIAGIGNPAEAAGSATKAAVGQGTTSVFGDLLDNTISTLKGAEHLSVQALQGDVDTRKVVDAVMNAEQSLQTAIAIRDKIVSAYLDISRMAI